MSGGSDRLRRADARENRARIVSSARALFAEQGLTVPMREIARLACVGPATLYRHFPTKEALARDAFAAEMRDCHAVVESGLHAPSASAGLRRVVEGLFELHLRNRGFTEAFLATFPDAVDLAAERRSAMRAVGDLVHRARADGELHPDVVPDDVVVALLAHRGLDGLTPRGRGAASRRLAALLLRGLRAAPDPAPAGASR